MHKAILIGALILVAIIIAVPARAQYWPYYGRCWGCGAYPPVIVGPPVIATPPIIMAPPPPVVVVQPSPPPPPPAVIIQEPQRRYYWVDGRRCWMQYAGSDRWGQPMYIQACD